VSVRVAALALLASACLAPSAGAAERFYLDRLQEGVTAADDDRAADAVQLLRVACFGLLEDPPLLGQCLGHLALAELAAGDAEAFRRTADRLLEAEARLQVLSLAELPAAVRRDLLEQLARHLPPERLATLPALTGGAESAIEEVRSLAPRARARRLAELRAAAPADPRWPRLAAELARDAGDVETVEAEAMQVLRLAPDDPLAKCLRGWAMARRGRCEGAIPWLAGCALEAGEPYAVELLRCRVEEEQWPEAAAWLDRMPAAWSAAGEGRRLADAVRSHPGEGGQP
jgi:hypothetical protein